MVQSAAATRVSKLALALVLIATVCAVHYAGQPPSPVPADAAPTEFSAERALRHVRAFAVEPHPSGTPASEKVRNYILGALATMGISAEVDVAVLPQGSKISEVHNVLARIPGTANTKAFALVAHYDSTPYGPGAADDGSGVATMLETARAIKAGPPLMNDLMLVFTDGEERGLTGARAFVHHPWAAEVGVLLNMETRGTSGPSGMFETTPHNGWLIRQLIRSGASVRASSLSYDVYKRMPTRSDLSVLRNHDFKGYNIAFIDDLPYYHTPNDNPENLSPASLQHHGSYAFNLARHLGNMPLNEVPDEPDAIFFNVFGPIVMQYPASLGVPLAVIAGLVFLGVITHGLHRKRLTLRGIGAGAGVTAAAILLTALIGAVIIGIAYHRSYIYILYNARPLAALFVAMTVLVASMVFRAFNRVSTPNLAAGALVWWLATLVVVQIMFPHGGYAALGPLLGGSLGLILLSVPEELPARRIWLHAPFILPAILLLVPMIRGLVSGLTLFMAPLVMAPVVLLLGLLAPQTRYFFNDVSRRSLALLTAVLALLLVFHIESAGGKPNQPIMNSVSYGLDRATGQAWWMSTDNAPDEWTAQFFAPDAPKSSVREFAPNERAPRMKTPAPIADLAPPTVEIASDTTGQDGRRHVSLRLTSPRRVPEIRVELDPPLRVSQANVDGREMSTGHPPYRHGGWSFHYEIFPRSGSAIIDLVVEGEGPLAGRILEKSYELPPIPFTPRPPYMINKPNSLDWFEKNRLSSGHTFVITPFTL